METNKVRTNSKTSSIIYDYFQNLEDSFPRFSDKAWFSPVVCQYLAMVAIFLANVNNGITSGQSASMIPQLQEQGSPFVIDTNDASWIASVNSLTTIFGSLMGGWLMEISGRKGAHILTLVPFTLSFIIIGLSDDLSLLLIGRVLSGLSMGLLSAFGPAYIGEISDPNNRSYFIPSLSGSNAVGILLVHMIGFNLNWQPTSYICVSIPLLSILIFFFVRESPTWLIKKGRIEEGIEAFHWYRGKGNNEQEEIDKIIKSIEENQEHELTLKQKIMSLAEPEVWRPTLVVSFLFVVVQCSGFNTVIAYAQEIISNTVGGGVSNFVSLFIVDLLRLVASILSCFTMRYINRRTIGILGLCLVTLSLFALSGLVYESEHSDISSTIQEVPLVLMVLYVFIVTLFLVPLPWTLSGEVFPSHVRGFCAGFSSAVGLVANFVVTKIAPDMFAAFAFSGTYLAYGCCCLFGLSILYFTLPETRGKTVIAIEEEYKNAYKNKE